MDRIGIAGAQGTGKTTLARRVADHYGYRYVDAGVGGLMTKLGVVVGWPMPLVERLRVQLAVAKHIAEKSSGSGSFVMDRTPVDVMVYTIDLLGQVNCEESLALFTEIQQVCTDTAIENFNAIIGLRPGIELSDQDKERDQRGSLDPLYVRRIDSLIGGELNHLNLFTNKMNLVIGFMPPTVTDLDTRVVTMSRYLDNAAKTHIRPEQSTLH